MKKLSVKERIIETASDLFYNNGYNQTGINQVIEEAQVSKSSMYQHFRSKEDIAVAYLLRRHNMWMNKLEDYVKLQNTPKAKVIGCFDYLMHWLLDVNFRGCGWQNISVDLPEDHQKIKDQAVYHKNELRHWVHDLLKQDNHYTEDEAMALGDEIMVLIDGAIILSQIQKDKWPIEVAKKACIKLLS